VRNQQKALAVLAVVGAVAVTTRAQTPPNPRASQSADWGSNGEINTFHVQGNVYLIANSKGSNIVAQVDDQGALLVDASVAELSDQVIAEIKRLWTKPIRYIINTISIRITPAATR
jgi:glyoxylase-like metal-dependent hydrolase (beta-lactamase superfamily II)